MDKVIHFEIPSDDKERAKKFYSNVFGWSIEDTPFQDGVYTNVITSPIDENYMHTEKGAINGGMFERNEETPNPVITIEVKSIDDYSKKIEEAGGNMLTQKGEVPEMGFYAYFKDSEGNIMGLWEHLK